MPMSLQFWFLMMLISMARMASQLFIPDLLTKRADQPHIQMPKTSTMLSNPNSEEVSPLSSHLAAKIHMQFSTLQTLITHLVSKKVASSIDFLELHENEFDQF